MTDVATAVTADVTDGVAALGGAGGLGCGTGAVVAWAGAVAAAAELLGPGVGVAAVVTDAAAAVAGAAALAVAAAPVVASGGVLDVGTAVEVAWVAAAVTWDKAEVAVWVTGAVVGVAVNVGVVAALACLENTSNTTRMPTVAIANCIARRAM